MPDRSPPSHQDVQLAHAALQEARLEYQSGQLDLQTYREQEEQLSAIIGQRQSLANLSRISHSTLQCVPTEQIPHDLTDDAPSSYLSPVHEEEYLSAIDSYLDAPHPDDQPLPPRSSKIADRDREREQQLRNPVSANNWLALHRPNVLLDHDATHEKTAKAARRSSPKVPSDTPATARSAVKKEKVSALLAKPEEELLDEDGFVIGSALEEGGGTLKKRKRGQDDDAYRPKGGGSKKRKRASTKTSNLGGGEGVVKRLEMEVEEA